MATYKIIRFFRDISANEVIAEGLTLEEAQAHCNDPETSASTATSAQALALTQARGPWFDGYMADDE
jgi:hypothetical protein